MEENTDFNLIEQHSYKMQRDEKLAERMEAIEDYSREIIELMNEEVPDYKAIMKVKLKQLEQEILIQKVYKINVKNAYMLQRMQNEILEIFGSPKINKSDEKDNIKKMEDIFSKVEDDTKKYLLDDDKIKEVEDIKEDEKNE
jgi:hypothetical protein